MGLLSSSSRRTTVAEAALSPTGGSVAVRGDGATINNTQTDYGAISGALTLADNVSGRMADLMLTNQDFTLDVYDSTLDFAENVNQEKSRIVDSSLQFLESLNSQANTLYTNSMVDDKGQSERLLKIVTFMAVSVAAIGAYAYIKS